jgi:hypothetical protein
MSQENVEIVRRVTTGGRTAISRKAMCSNRAKALEAVELRESGKPVS